MPWASVNRPSPSQGPDGHCVVYGGGPRLGFQALESLLPTQDELGGGGTSALLRLAVWGRVLIKYAELGSQEDGGKVLNPDHGSMI